MNAKRINKTIIYLTGKPQCIIILNTKHQTPNTKHQTWQTYVLNLSNRRIRRIFTLASLISSKLSLKLLSKLSRKIPLALVLLSLLLSSLNSQALSGQNSRGGDRSDAIILPPGQWGRIKSAKSEGFYFDRDYGVGPYAGPAELWDPDYGFLLQSTNPASYALNFPTTGANALYFYIVVEGEGEVVQLWEPVTHEGIKAAVRPWIQCGSEECHTEYRVTLTGPEAGNQWLNPYPGPIAKPNLPQTFELVGKDSEGSEILKYGFTLQKWFVARGQSLTILPEQQSWCNSIGYRLPQVRDLTNARAGRFGATPSSSGNHYQRRIGSGLFTEWSPMNRYDRARLYYSYWTSDGMPVPDGSYQHGDLIVASYDGGVGVDIVRGIHYAMCVTP
ncbi:hypothetical protein [Gilliamella sp. Pas-s25]|uniref:hypothetical protein n=1 Tax=Gilliamella sp. Pas-s25 TaxID=2687310 RepID=UPI00135DDB40|nr:hypothetical protein [Gilliamella sp. Pas-s25]MWP62226.1 hypothetical protein [Gilliamella sp. Pas-s25]